MKNIALILLFLPLFIHSQWSGYLGEDTIWVCKDQSTSIRPNISRGPLPVFYEWEKLNSDYFFIPDTLKQHGPLEVYPTNAIPGERFVLYILDRFECLYHKEYIVKQMNEISLNYILTYPPTCYGRTDGELFFLASGGKSPLSYLLDGTYVHNHVQNLSSGDYNLEIVDDLGCEIIEQFYIPEGPLKPFDNINIITQCNTILIDLEGESGPYELELNDEPLLTNIISIKEDIEYNLKIIDKYGCEFDTILPLFEMVEFNIDEIIIENPECPDVKDGSIKIIESDRVSYEWMHTNLDTNFVDGLDVGFYSVLITNLDNKCEINFEFNLDYERLQCLIIPNAFSPNGDGINDHWEIKNLNKLYPNNEVKIYDRWGQLLFKSEGYLDPWDGTKNNIPLPVNSYHYIITLGEGNIRTGQVSIIR